MTGDEIIEKYNLQVDDASELSSDEELALANDVYDDVCDDRDWEWLKESFTGTTSISVPYIALPDDFKYIAPNKDNRSVVFVGDEFSEYEVVSYSDRRNYRNMSGFCYIDVPNSRLVFTLQPTEAKSVEYDYIKIQEPLEDDTSPLFRSGFHVIIAYGMAAKFNNLEQTDKAVSYQRENTGLYNGVLSKMQMEDSKVKLSL